jgi:hypothetical protein
VYTRIFALIAYLRPGTFYFQSMAHAHYNFQMRNYYTRVFSNLFHKRKEGSKYMSVMLS